MIARLKWTRITDEPQEPPLHSMYSVPYDALQLKVKTIVLNPLAVCVCRLEKRLLSNVTYYTDYCVTHEDTDYMSKM